MMMIEIGFILEGFHKALGWITIDVDDKNTNPRGEFPFRSKTAGNHSTSNRACILPWASILWLQGYARHIVIAFIH